MRRLILASACLLLLCSSVSAQTLNPSQITRIDAVFSDYAKPDSPGCALGIYRNGAITYAHGYGMASLELRVPITSQTVFDIGSTSKQFTAFSILLLQQQGKLSVDDDIRKFMPEIPDYGRRITLHHLMTHTSGMRDYAGLFDLAGVPEQNLTNDEDAIDLIVRQKALNFMPGDEWDYSNTGFFLLSQVVKRVTGKTLRDFDEENIFTPLGMSSTQIFNDHRLVIPRRATGYSYDSKRKAFGVEMSNFEQTGDGSIQTNVEDLERWDENFYTAKVGGSDLIRQMRVVGKLNNGEEHGYAAGLEITKYRGQPAVRHGGAWAGYRSELLRFPLQHTSIAVLCNVAQSGPDERANRVADVVLAGRLAQIPQRPPPVQLSSDSLQQDVGVYRSDKGQYQRIEFKEGKLWLANYGMELIPRSENDFGLKITDGEVSFSKDELSLQLSAAEKLEKYIRIQTHTPKDLAPFTGDFYSSELDATWQLRVHAGQLTAHIKHSDSPDINLLPIDDHTFTIEGGSLRFEDVDGAPAKRGFLTVDRIRNIEFVKN